MLCRTPPGGNASSGRSSGRSGRRAALRPTASLQLALSDPAAPPDPLPMAVFVWQQDMDPDFPLAVLEYTVLGDRDPMHWHDHFALALVTHGRGVVMLGRRRVA